MSYFEKEVVMMLSFILRSQIKLYLKGLNYSTKYWQISVSDGINPPVLSAIRAFTTTSFQMRDSYLLKKKNDNYVIYSGDADGNKLQLTNSSINMATTKNNR
jgi:hypothetical protein